MYLLRGEDFQSDAQYWFKMDIEQMLCLMVITLSKCSLHNIKFNLISHPIQKLPDLRAFNYKKIVQCPQNKINSNFIL